MSDLSEFERGIVGARFQYLRNGLLGFSRSVSVYGLQRTVGQTNKHPVSGSPVGRNQLVDERGRRWVTNTYTVQQSCSLGSFQIKTRRRGSSGHHQHHHWTIEEWKNIVWSDESRVRIWCKRHDSMDRSCLVSTVQGWWCTGVGMFSWLTLL